MTGGKKVLDRRQRRRLDDVDHDWSGEHGDSSAADAGGRVFHADQQL